MLSLMTFFFCIFLPDFHILHILIEILNNFHDILEEKRFFDDFFVFVFLYVNRLTKKFQ